MANIAKFLLETKSVHIEPNEDKFFTWTSGKRSPIYCDNRQLISHVEVRNAITDTFTELIKTKYPNVDLIAGTATAGIPWAAWIANALNLPMIYIRSKPKGHGLKSAIEGHAEKGAKTLIIEDLISTGKSSIEAVNHAKADELEVLGVLSIFSYGFQEAKEKFKLLNLEKTTLCTLEKLLKYAHEENLLSETDIETVKRWRDNF